MKLCVWLVVFHRVFLFVCLLGCLGFFKDTSLKYFLLLNTMVSRPAEEMLTSCKRKEGGNEEVEKDSWSS